MTILGAEHRMADVLGRRSTALTACWAACAAQVRLPSIQHTCRQLAVLPQHIVSWHGSVLMAQLLQALLAPAKVAGLIVCHMGKVVIEGLRTHAVPHLLHVWWCTATMHPIV